MPNVGDRVRINEHNAYDADDSDKPTATFTDLEGKVVRIEREMLYVHLDTPMPLAYITEENPWPFYENEVDLVV